MIVKYFTSGRHSKCDTFYLTQRYYALDKTIRDNANLVISFDNDEKTAEALQHSMVNNGLTLKEFKQ